MADDSTYDFAGKPGEDAVKEGHAAPVKPPVEFSEERHCPQCGFRMVGKRRNRCPQCSAPLDASVADLLQNSSDVWVRSLSWGPLLMAAAVVCHTAAILFAWSPGALGRITQALHIVGAACLCAGAWIVTADEGPGRPMMRRALLALIARWVSLSAAILWVMTILLLGIGRLPAMHNMMAVTLILMAVEIVALCGFLSALAGRIPHDTLATQFQNMAWVMPAALFAAFLAQYYDPREFFAWLFFCSFPLVGGLVGLLIWAVVTALRMTIELRRSSSSVRAFPVGTGVRK